MDFSQPDLSVLFWVVGSTHGASADEVLRHEQTRHRQPPTAEAIRERLDRLEAAGLISLVGDRYQGDPGLQRAFLNECRNCRDTIEEVAILSRLIDSMKRHDTGA